jgi:Fungal chitosanase of glycosyl hydrolase group 75
MTAASKALTTIGDSIIRQIPGETAWFFRAGMSIDADGSPHAYHPNDIGLDNLHNAGDPDDWYGIAVGADNIPYVQSLQDPAPGYYVSPTSLCDPSKSESDPARYVNSEVVSYIALPAKLVGNNTKLGDFCMVINTVNQSMAGAIVADCGGNSHIGEGSIALAQKLGIDDSPKQGGCSDGIIYVVFPRSSKGFSVTSDSIESISRHLFQQWGGVDKLQAFFPALFTKWSLSNVSTTSEKPATPSTAVRTLKQPLSFGWACLKRMQALGWDLEHHEHKDRPGEYWIQWGIEDCTKLGVPLPNDFWDDEYNDRYCTGIWIPSKQSFRMTLNCGATVEPGVYYTTHPMNPNGAARLDNEVQFKAWRWGMHGTAKRYRAMVQAADLTYTRDLNQDGFRTGDRRYTTSGNYINLHHGWNSQTIDKNGAACQVCRFEEDHDFRNAQADEYPHPEGDYFAYGILDGQKLAAFWKSFA